jgi:hypothetical protein
MTWLPTLKDSAPSPLRLDEILCCKDEGRLGLTICLGKKDLPRKWNRSLDEDLSVIRNWGASTVVTLIEAREFELLNVGRLGELVQKQGMRWIHLPKYHTSLLRADFHSRCIASKRSITRSKRSTNILVGIGETKKPAGPVDAQNSNAIGTNLPLINVLSDSVPLT